MKDHSSGQAPLGGLSVNQLESVLRRERPEQTEAANVVSHHLARNEHAVSPVERAQRARHYGGVVWLTGLSGAGKTTLAMDLERELFEQGFLVYVLDGDNLRQGLNADLGFSPEDRSENIRRVGEVAALFADAGVVCIVALISPYRADRARARLAAKQCRFMEVYVSADLATCEARDPRGLYRLARGGKLRDFTGIDAPYEAPEAPEVIVDTTLNDRLKCVQTLVHAVMGYLVHR